MQLSKFCLLFCLFVTALSGDEEHEEPLAKSFTAPLYVSLGGDCLSAGMIRHFGLRQAAFPFDWMVTMDDRKLVEILGRNFEEFASEKYFMKQPINGCQLAHSYYHMEFSHDWDVTYWDDPIKFQEGVERLQAKYQRRITRFRKLSEFGGKVIFIRVLYLRKEYKDIYPGVFWFDDRNDHDERQVALRLDQALKEFFPNLDYQLIVVSKSDGADRIERIGNVTLFYFSDVNKHQNWEALFSLSKK